MGRKRHEVESESEEDDEPVGASSSSRTASKKKKAKAQEDGDPVLPPSLHTKPTKYPYRDVHRGILQLFLALKVIEDKDLGELARKLTWDPRQDVAQLVKEINEKLSNEDMYMQIRPRQMVDEDSNRKVWILVSLRDDDISKEATQLEAWELALFNACLEILAQAQDGSVSHTEALHAYNAIKDKVNKSSSQITATLRKLVRLGWLRETRTHFYTAGARTLLELGEVLRDYGATECPISKQVVLKTGAYKTWLAAQPGSLQQPQ